MKIENFKTRNIYYDQLLTWKKNRFSSKDLKESFEPIESKWGSGNVIASDIFKNPTPEENERFDKYWLNKIFSNKSTMKDLQEELRLKGFSLKESNQIINSSTCCKENLKTWSKSNISLGKKSSRFALLSLFTGILKAWTTGKQDNRTTGEDKETTGKQDDRNEGIEASSPVSLALSIVNGFFRSQRNLHQYTMYSLPDDDAAMNVYQADVYGNKVAGSLARASTFMERNINPYLMPISEILPSNIGECFRKLAVIPTSLWWRARMPAYINQEFFTDFLKYMFHKPLAAFGNENSRDKVKGVRDRGNLKWDYFVKRHRENISGGETLYTTSQQTIKHIRSLFSRDPTIQMESSKQLGEFLAPVLGMYGFFTSALGNTTSAIFRLLNIENKLSGLANLIQTSSLFSQQLIYLPKIIIPFYSETRQIENILKNTNIKEHEKQKIKELKLLVKDRKVTSYAGMFGFYLHGVNLLLKTIGATAAAFPRVIDESACGLTNYFFSSRRYAMGEQFRIENPEFYEAS